MSVGHDKKASSSFPCHSGRHRQSKLSRGQGQYRPATARSRLLRTLTLFSDPLQMACCGYSMAKSDRFISLLPPGELNGPCDLQQYKNYVEAFYTLNKLCLPHLFTSAADAVFLCLEENHMRYWWNVRSADSDYVSGPFVSASMFSVMEGGEAGPYGIDAALCIAKEAELIIEWLKRGGSFRDNEEYNLCHHIRKCAYNLFLYKGKWWSIHIAAAFLGIRKEAEWLIKNLRLGSNESITTSMKIRQSALDFIYQMFEEAILHLKKESAEFYGLIIHSGWDDNDDSDSDDNGTEWY